MIKFNHPFHLLTFRPWPLLRSFRLIIFMVGSIKFLTKLNFNLFTLGIILIILICLQWWRDVIRESTFQGFHTLKVLNGIRLGILIFILSELIFFISFFWTYFHNLLAPSIKLGILWPPINIISFNPFNIPLLNTVILLSSGVSITFCHHRILNKKFNNAKIRIFITIILGLIFSIFQYIEYFESYFNISNSIYGSIFYIATGFHGIHVIIGTLFIIVSYYRLFFFHYSINHHFGFEASSWYWHFVDVVWLFLYIFIYWISY